MGAAGVARTTASAVMVSGVRVSPTTSSKPGRPAYAGARGPSRRCGRRTARCPPGPAAGGPCRRGRRRRRVRRTSAGWRRCRAASRPARRGVTSWGVAARAESRRAWPAYTPPRSGSTRRSTTSSPNRPATRSPTEMSPSSSSGGSVGSSRTRARPPSERTPERSRSSTSSGTPISERGSGRRSPRVQTAGPRGRGVDDLEVELAGEVDPLGASVEHRLGADVDGHPRDLGQPQLAAEPG